MKTYFVLACIAAMLMLRSFTIAGVPKAEEAESQQAARAAAESWLKLVDEKKYDESWQAAAESFRKVVTKSAWGTAIKTAREPLGKLKSRTFKSAESRTSLPGAPDGHYVILQFESVLENKKAAVETITPALDADGQWRVSGYFIR